MRDFSIDRLSIRIFSDRAALGRTAGQAAAGEIQRVLAAHGQARIILASAPSQNELLDALTSAPIDWTRVTIFHMDEYVGLEATHPATFRHYQRTHVLSRVQPASFHGIAGESPDPAAECARYAALLTAAPIDLVCLGIGENGHIAFNDPPVADFTDDRLVKIVELDSVCRQQQVNDGCFPTLDAVPRHALTLTVPALMSGRALFCAVPGPRKASAVRDALLGPISPTCPASILRTHANATLYLDRDSAALLPT